MWITFDDIMMTVNQSDSVPERAGEYKHQITLTFTRQDKRSYSALASKISRDRKGCILDNYNRINKLTLKRDGNGV